MNISVATHCWKYSRLLAYHLSGYILYPPRACEVSVDVYASRQDPGTQKVLADMAPLFQAIPNVCLRPHFMETHKLLFRGLWRHHHAQITDADVVWFLDVDHIIHGKALDHIAGFVGEHPDNNLFWPANHYRTATHKHGDKLIQQVDLDQPEKYPLKIDYNLVPWQAGMYGSAVGGVQIIRASSLKEKGYLPKFWLWRLHKRSRQMRRQIKRGGPMAWARCHEDVPGRKQVGQKAMKIYSRKMGRGITRIRHSVAGRDDPSCIN